MGNKVQWLYGASTAVLLVAGCITPAKAQNATQAYVVASCGTPGITLTAGKNGPVFQDTTGTLCTAGGGGGGGLSITDQAAFTQGTSKFTPGGCEFNDTTTLTSGQQGMFRCNTKRAEIIDTDTTGSNLYALISGPTPAGSNIIGKFGIDQTTVGTTNGVSLAQIGTATVLTGNGTSGTGSQRVNIASDNTAFPVLASLQAIATGGASTAGAIVPNNTTAVSVKGSAGTIYGVQLGGIGSVPAYLKIYDSAAVTCGSGTPIKRLIIPAASTAANGAGSNISFGTGIVTSAGIGYCITTGITDADTTAPTANLYLVNVDFK